MVAKVALALLNGMALATQMISRLTVMAAMIGKKRVGMKIVSWNINESKPWKIEQLLGLGADVLVAPEITYPGDAHLPESYEMVWKGVEYFYHGKQWKGLGVIWQRGHGFVPEWYNPEQEYAIPLIVDDHLILGIWPTKPTDGRLKKPYPQIAQEIIEEYAPHYNQYKTLVVGDFNCYVNQYDDTKKSGDMLRVNEMLESYGLHSLYHLQTGEPFGKETEATYYHRFHEYEPYFWDYAYTNFQVASFRMFPWNKEMSDHIGLEVCF